LHRNIETIYQGNKKKTKKTESSPSFHGSVLPVEKYKPLRIAFAVAAPDGHLLSVDGRTALLRPMMLLRVRKTRQATSHPSILFHGLACVLLFARILG